MRFLGLTLLLAGMAAAAMAQDGTAQVPEISGSSAASALALVSGAIALLRSRMRRK